MRKPFSTALASAWLAIAGCGTVGGPASRAIEAAYPFDPGAITVSAAENFYADMLHALGGRRLKVYSFISDPNADPHEFEAAPADARAVADSRVVIENGLGYDAFMDRLIKAAPNPARRVIDVQHLVGADAGANPHLWYAPATMPAVASAAADALAGVDPENAAVYRSNLSAYLASLQPVAARLAQLKPRVEGMPIAFTEPVYAYMAAALGLEVRSPESFMKAIEEGNDPPTSAVAAEEDLITKHRVRALIYNSQTVTKITGRMKDLATRSGVPVVGVSEMQPPGQTFPQWQLATLDRLAAALGAQ